MKKNYGDLIPDGYTVLGDKFFGREQELCVLVSGNNVGVYNCHLGTWPLSPLPISYEVVIKELKEVSVPGSGNI